MTNKDYAQYSKVTQRIQQEIKELHNHWLNMIDEEIEICKQRKQQQQSQWLECSSLCALL